MSLNSYKQYKEHDLNVVSSCYAHDRGLTIILAEGYLNYLFYFVSPCSCFSLCLFTPSLPVSKPHIQYRSIVGISKWLQLILFYPYKLIINRVKTKAKSCRVFPDLTFLHTMFGLWFLMLLCHL